jgi:hypothetical protein
MGQSGVSRIQLRLPTTVEIGNTETARKGSLMASIPLRAKGTFALVVAPQHLANQFKDATLPPVLATPVMIMAMENAALNALKPTLEPGEIAVGTAVAVRHVAATPVGQRIVAEAEVTGDRPFRSWPPRFAARGGGQFSALSRESGVAASSARSVQGDGGAVLRIRPTRLR